MSLPPQLLAKVDEKILTNGGRTCLGKECLKHYQAPLQQRPKAVVLMFHAKLEAHAVQLAQSLLTHDSTLLPQLATEVVEKITLVERGGLPKFQSSEAPLQQRPEAGALLLAFLGDHNFYPAPDAPQERGDSQLDIWVVRARHLRQGDGKALPRHLSFHDSILLRANCDQNRRRHIETLTVALCGDEAALSGSRGTGFDESAEQLSPDSGALPLCTLNEGFMCDVALLQVERKGLEPVAPHKFVIGQFLAQVSPPRMM